MAKDTEQIQRIMAGLKCSEEEAHEILAYDKAIDKGEKTEYDLPQDKLEVARKFAHTGTRKTPTVYKFTKRERKPNATKAGIIAELFTFLAENSDFAVENAEIMNKERQIGFNIGDDRFELTLVQKRKPKTKEMGREIAPRKEKGEKRISLCRALHRQRWALSAESRDYK